MKSPSICPTVSSNGLAQNSEYRSSPATRDFGRSTSTFMRNETAASGFNGTPQDASFPGGDGDAETDGRVAGARFALLVAGILALFLAAYFFSLSSHTDAAGYVHDLEYGVPLLVGGAVLSALGASVRR